MTGQRRTPRWRWRWVAASIGLVFSLSVASAATADLTHNGRFVFFPTIDHGDPVNLVFTGGNDQSVLSACDGGDSRSAGCVREHMVTDWTRGDMDEEVCAGHGGLKFHKESGGTTPFEQENESLVTSHPACQHEFHIRIWDDVPHGHPTDHHMWDAAAIHHEHTTHVFAGHAIDMSWESVEHVAIQQMGRSQEGEPAHCTYPDYHALPGSGPGKLHGWYSNGRISRISFHHISNGGCRGA